MPVPLWRKLRHAGIDYEISASELARRGVRLALAYIGEHGVLPPARAGLVKRLARSMAPGEPDLTVADRTVSGPDDDLPDGPDQTGATRPNRR